MKIARFDRLLASTALALVLALSSQTGNAQQTEKAVQASVPVPDTSLPPPLTAKDFETPAKQAAPADVIKDEPKQNVTAPSVEPAKAATAPAAPPAATADSAVADKLRELVASRQFERLVNHKADRAGIEAFYSAHNYAPLWITNNAATGAPRLRSPIWRRPTLSVSTRATIRPRISSRRRPPMRWPRPNSS